MSEQFKAKTFLKTVTNQPGVYRMYDSEGTVIYVGKAKDLKKRLFSYFQGNINNHKTEKLIKNIASIDVTVTQIESEALLLEQNYIKLYQPRYNVLLRDDKSYPYILLSQATHPRLSMHHGITKMKGEYFGPFPNAYAVKATLTLIQKLFPIRQCNDAVYNNRSKPCLQYQINRCLAPCVKDIVSHEEYDQQVNYVRLFLTGKDNQVLIGLIKRMEKASEKLNFEKAEYFRNQIESVRSITKQQYISSNSHDLDVISVAFKAGLVCIHILYIRQGKILGSQSYYPNVPEHSLLEEVIYTFLNQFYLQDRKNRKLPHEILLDFIIAKKKLLTDSLYQIAGRKIDIQTQPRGAKAYYLKLAHANASTALITKLTQQTTVHQRISSLANILHREWISRIECFDISHAIGEQPVASCVVFNKSGPIKSEYRRYNIKGLRPGDDYAAIRQVLNRRYNKYINENKIPDIIFIDGGKEHLNIAKNVFDSLSVSWDKNRPLLIGVAKGSDRRTGLERLFFESEGNGLILPYDSIALHLIQYIRDEAYNYTLIGHRQRQTKVKNTSILESIKGVGPKRRQILLKYMGGLQSLKNSSIKEMIKIPSISYVLAEKIYNTLKQ
ncbi:UvrABC system protein C [Candidatus Hartigia pinicola]|nr:UvrABC system protein C [Candidatus Hartigia pinicola]